MNAWDCELVHNGELNGVVSELPPYDFISSAS